MTDSNQPVTNVKQEIKQHTPDIKEVKTKLPEKVVKSVYEQAVEIAKKKKAEVIQKLEKQKEELKYLDKERYEVYVQCERVLREFNGKISNNAQVFNMQIDSGAFKCSLVEGGFPVVNIGVCVDEILKAVKIEYYFKEGLGKRDVEKFINVEDFVKKLVTDMALKIQV